MNKNVIIGLLCAVLVIVLACGGMLIFKSMKTNEEQQEKIQELNRTIRELSGENEQTEEADLENEPENEVQAESAAEKYQYLAIGNNITIHGITDYWWNECGMAASRADKDYVHLVEAHLKSTHPDTEVSTSAFNYTAWETENVDRAGTYGALDPYLNADLDLVTIQLSENVTDITTFQTDFEALIRYIQAAAPEAQIIVIDDFWIEDEKVVEKAAAAENTGVQFASLFDIKGNQEYQCGLGTIVYDADGNEHTVEHEGVAVHPGDNGMEYIAQAVIGQIH